MADNLYSPAGKVSWEISRVNGKVILNVLVNGETYFRMELSPGAARQMARDLLNV